VKDAIEKYAPGWNTPNEAWCVVSHYVSIYDMFSDIPPWLRRCAAHLNMLCNYAIRNYEKHGTRLDPSTKELVPRGLLINYDALPGYVPQILLPHFGIDPLPAAWLLKVTEESNFYSKSRGTKAKAFSGDSHDKDSRATKAIQEFAEKILAPTYRTLEQLGRKSIPPARLAEIMKQHQLQSEADFDWKILKPIPTLAELAGATGTGTVSGAALASSGAAAGPAPTPRSKRPVSVVETLPTKLLGVGHSTVLKEKEFVPWDPFTNHHSSRPVQVSIALAAPLLYIPQ
jgi:hypothetical protein